MNTMRVSLAIALIGILGSLGFGAGMIVSADAHDEKVCDVSESAWCVAPRIESSLSDLPGATVPRLATPAWMSEPMEPSVRTVTYDVRTRGNITSDLATFSTVAAQTLNDARGWALLGIQFEEITDGESDFTLWLSEASSLTTFSPTGCDTTYSCNVGRDVIINQDRWEQATPSWNNAGGSLADYRSMVINHETGHWLGHGHYNCPVAGQPAPVMQQQSMDMQGCEPNPWPLPSERYAPNLGIRS